MRLGSQLMGCALVLLPGLIPQACPAEVLAEGQVDTAVITVGDPITYRLKVRWGSGDRVAFPDVPVRLGDLEVREVSKPKFNQGRTAEEDYVLTSYRVGVFEIPALPVAYVSASGDTGQVKTRPMTITVRSVIKEGEQRALKDVKPPVDLAEGVPWWVWALIGLLLAAGLYYLYRRRRRRAAERGTVAEGPPEPIDELGEFDRIAAMGLLAQGKYKHHYSLVSAAMRHYVERRYGIEATERTTWEITSEMKRGGVDGTAVGRLTGFLSACDLVKFAKYIPPPEEMEAAIDRAKEIVRATIMTVENPGSKVQSPKS